jgi:prepilin-type N-terminal cleavage/methylation domain-containing protein
LEPNSISNPSVTDAVGLEIRPTTLRPRCALGFESGFTLLEVTVVLAVLGVFAAVSWPLLRPQFETSLLQGAAKQVRTELAKTRHRAMETGVAQHFLYQPGQRRFEVVAGGEPQPNAVSATNGLDAERVGLAHDASGDEKPTSHHADVQHLPEGVCFARSELDPCVDPDVEQRSADPVPSEAHDTMGGGRAPSELHAARRIEWAAPIAFYPDGRTSNATIRLESEGGATVDITLRGLTGVVTIGQLHRAEESLESDWRNARPTHSPPRWHHSL